MPDDRNASDRLDDGANDRYVIVVRLDSACGERELNDYYTDWVVAGMIDLDIEVRGTYALDLDCG